MLTILKLKEEPEKKFAARLLSRFTRPQIKTRFGMAENTHYLEITAMTRKGMPDWRMISASVLDPGGRMLVEDNVRLPQDAGLSRFVSSSFERKMLENLVLDVLVQMKKPPQDRRLVIYGRENEICRFLPVVYRLVGEICVLTRRPYAIADIAQQLERQTGTAVIVSDKLSVGQCDILLAPSGGAAVLDCSGAGIVVSPDAAVGVRRAMVALPAVLEDAYDERFGVQEFTAAFYEIAGLRSLGGLHPSCAVTDRGELSASEIAEYLDDRGDHCEQQADCG